MSQSSTSPQDDRRPSAFLSLLPTQSDSFPTRKQSIARSTEGTEAEAKPVDEESVHRRSSSTSTTGAGERVEPVGLRYLKLGPVHWGEGDGKGDWSFAVVE